MLWQGWEGETSSLLHSNKLMANVGELPRNKLLTMGNEAIPLGGY